MVSADKVLPGAPEKGDDGFDRGKTVSEIGGEKARRGSIARLSAPQVLQLCKRKKKKKNDDEKKNISEKLKKITSFYLGGGWGRSLGLLRRVWGGR
jgi:hypothetical protein